MTQNAAESSKARPPSTRTWCGDQKTPLASCYGANGRECNKEKPAGVPSCDMKPHVTYDLNPLIRVQSWDDSACPALHGSRRCPAGFVTCTWPCLHQRVTSIALQASQRFQKPFQTGLSPPQSWPGAGRGCAVISRLKLTGNGHIM